MNHVVRAGVPLGVGLVGFFVGLVPGFPTLELLATVVVGQAAVVAGVVGAGLVAAARSVDPWSPTGDPPVREVGNEFGLSTLATMALFGLTVVPGAPARAVTVGAALGIPTCAFLGTISTVEWATGTTDPEGEVEAMLGEVTYEAFRSADAPEDRDPLEPLIRYAQRSLDDRDYRRAIFAIDALETASERILESASEAGANPPDLERLFDHWDELGRTALDRGTDEVLSRVARAQATLAVRSLWLGLDRACATAGEHLALFCERAVADDRILDAHVEALEAVLTRAIAAEDPDVDAVVAAMERVREAIECRGTDRHGTLTKLAVALLAGQRRLVADRGERVAHEPSARLYADLESAVDRCVADLLVTGAAVNRVGEALAELGVVAAENDQQWIVRRVATRIVDLHSSAADGYGNASEHVQRLHDAGGEDGVERAFEDVREAYDEGGYPEHDDPVERLES